MQRWVEISLWVSGMLVIVVLLGFVGKYKKEQACKNIIVKIDRTDGDFFVEEEEIRNNILGKRDSVGMINMEAFNISDLEMQLQNYPHIHSAEAYKTIDGQLFVEITQRKPIARVFSKGESYYIDEGGRLMPLASKFSSRVMVVNGFIDEPYAKRYKYDIPHIIQNDSLGDKTLLDDIFVLTKYISKNEFWEAQIEQVYVNKHFELELIPKVGNHRIVFGDTVHLQEKFEKLMIFYREGLSKTGWNEYREINLKYKDQVVCKKRY